MESTKRIAHWQLQKWASYHLNLYATVAASDRSPYWRFFFNFLKFSKLNFSSLPRSLVPRISPCLSRAGLHGFQISALALTSPGISRKETIYNVNNQILINLLVFKSVCTSGRHHCWPSPGRRCLLGLLGSSESAVWTSDRLINSDRASPINFETLIRLD